MKTKAGQAIVVTSGKGGTGKTTTVGAVSSCLAALGHRTLCLDCDVGLKNLDLTLGLADMTLSDFTDCLEGRKTLEEAVISHPKIKNLDFLSAPTSVRPESIDMGKMRALIGEIKEKYEYCLIDSPAGLGAGFELSACGADMAVIVATGDGSSVRDGQRVAAELQRAGVKNTRLLVKPGKAEAFPAHKING